MSGLGILKPPSCVSFFSSVCWPGCGRARSVLVFLLLAGAETKLRATVEPNSTKATTTSAQGRSPRARMAIVAQLHRQLKKAILAANGEPTGLQKFSHASVKECKPVLRATRTEH